MTNKYFLKDGRNFIINPDNEEHPHEARKLKKNFLLCINPQDLRTDKLWNVEAIRALGTGLVQSTSGKKRASKAELVDRLIEYIDYEQKLVLSQSETIVAELQEAGYNTNALLQMIGTLHGIDLVNAIESSLLLGNFKPSTITKTYLPDISKAINSHYQGSDKNDVREALHARFAKMRMKVDEEGRNTVSHNNNNRRAVKVRILEQYIASLVEPITNGSVEALNELSWKEISICLSFATGRRCAEVHGVKTEFTVTDTHKVLFKGQLKTKKRGEIPPYEIPTMIPAETVVKLFARLRELGKASYTPEAVHSKLSKALSTELPSHIKRVFDQAGVTQYKDLRDIYSILLLKDMPVTSSERAWISKYLGHYENDLQTGSSYLKIWLQYED